VKQRAKFIGEMKELLRSRLEEMNQRLMSQSHEKASNDTIQDSADEALSLSMEKLQSSLQKTEIDELQLIEDALDRILKEEYGICVDCGEPISEKRLLHYPYAARCIVCQEAFEQ